METKRSSRIIRAQEPGVKTRLPIIGKIRIGEKKTNQGGKEYPVSLDYFKPTGDYASKFTDEYGEKPNRIQIVFISDDDWQSCIEEWQGRDKSGRKAAYGDGENYYLWDEEKKEYTATTDRKKVAEYSKKEGIAWKVVLTINFLIPKIRGVFGVWQLQTSGDKSSISGIRGVYDEMKELLGTVVNVPFDLVVKKVKSDKPGTASVYPVVSLVPNISHENMEELRAFITHGMDLKKAGLLTENKIKALGESIHGSQPEDVEIIDENHIDPEFRKQEVGCVHPPEFIIEDLASHEKVCTLCGETL